MATKLSAMTLAMPHPTQQFPQAGCESQDTAEPVCIRDQSHEHSQTSALLRLPRELRDLVYHHLYQIPSTICKASPVPPVLATCKQLRLENLHDLYEFGIFHVELEFDFCLDQALPSSLSQRASQAFYSNAIFHIQQQAIRTLSTWLLTVPHDLRPYIRTIECESWQREGFERRDHNDEWATSVLSEIVSLNTGVSLHDGTVTCREIPPPCRMWDSATSSGTSEACGECGPCRRASREA
ncbi:hypothetical protein LTR56_013143 [Elasticomyces elasticus]|nr:hypothetical protein LTR56_013143 [Elasticomyces elasticus]KAK3656681.1 hypothetical protein LTR22_009660 [Elasticomyces elasticus]KAK4921553.1 hypothetical protein LTR49_011023 [Elasticomyces elasticus]KAK5760241.1 hypothetical protein LTS12_009625 [Elasticomyces elasticus]